MNSLPHHTSIWGWFWCQYPKEITLSAVCQSAPVTMELGSKFQLIWQLDRSLKSTVIAGSMLTGGWIEDIFLTSNFRYLIIWHLHQSKLPLAPFAAKGEKQAALVTSIRPFRPVQSLLVTPGHRGLFLCPQGTTQRWNESELMENLQLLSCQTAKVSCSSPPPSIDTMGLGSWGKILKDLGFLQWSME